jgi:hypothetical protein
MIDSGPTHLSSTCMILLPLATNKSAVGHSMWPQDGLFEVGVQIFDVKGHSFPTIFLIEEK